MTLAVVLVASVFLVAVTLSIRDRTKHVKAPLVYIGGALLISSLIVYIAQRDRDAANRRRDQAATTADVRYAACVGFNGSQAGARNAQLNNALVTYGLAEPGQLGEADRERIVGALRPELQERYRKVVEQAAIDYPFRDCSPSAIEAFYKNPAVDPAVTTTTEDTHP